MACLMLLLCVNLLLGLCCSFGFCVHVTLVGGFGVCRLLLCLPGD